MSELERLLDASIAEKANMKKVRSNMCNDCNVPLLLGNECICPQCGRVYSYQASGSTNPSTGTVRMSTRGGRSKLVGISSNPKESRSKNVMDTLMDRKKKQDALGADGIIIPQDVLQATADAYAELQNKTEDKPDSHKFVKRGSVRDKVLAALLEIKASEMNSARKPCDISKFMGLSDGYSKGTIIVAEVMQPSMSSQPSAVIKPTINVTDTLTDNLTNNLTTTLTTSLNTSLTASLTTSLQSSLNTPVENTIQRDAESFAERYLEKLGLPQLIIDRYKKFVSEIIMVSVNNCIGYRSQPTSKVAGTIYILNRQLKWGKSVLEIETAVDGTKKNTFSTFANAIDKYKDDFRAVFTKYGVPY